MVYESAYTKSGGKCEVGDKKRVCEAEVLLKWVCRQREKKVMTMNLSIDLKGAKLVFEGSLEEITDVLDILSGDSENGSNADAYGLLEIG